MNWDEVNKNNIVTYCFNCLQKEPCNCENKNYIRTLDFVYERLKNYKPH